LNLAGLLDEPTKGRVVIDRVDAHHMRGGTKSKFRLRKLGFVFQFFNLFQELTAIENVILPALAMGRRREQYLTKAAMLLKSLGLAKRIRHYPHQLSGGEQQRVAIARALINDPILLLTDEPTANVDSVTAQRIVETFEQLNRRQKIAILMVTHEQELTAKAHRVIELKDGAIADERGSGRA
jgi:putative ABC transport system ATP-binding protein